MNKDLETSIAIVCNETSDHLKDRSPYSEVRREQAVNDVRKLLYNIYQIKAIDVLTKIFTEE